MGVKASFADDGFKDPLSEGVDSMMLLGKIGVKTLFLLKEGKVGKEGGKGGEKLVVGGEVVVVKGLFDESLRRGTMTFDGLGFGEGKDGASDLGSFLGRKIGAASEDKVDLTFEFGWGERRWVVEGNGGLLMGELGELGKVGLDNGEEFFTVVSMVEEGD